MSKSTHRVIEAADTPASIGPGDLALTIAWADGSETVEHVSEKAAALLGYQYPDPQPPAPPTWMVEVMRDAITATSNTEEAYGPAIIRLALERGHVVEPRPVPTEGEMLKAARKDGAQAAEARGLRGRALYIRRGEADDSSFVFAALQARRNMLREGAVAVPTKAPVVDWEVLVDRLIYAVNRHWTTLMTGSGSTSHAGRELQAARAALLSTLPTREA